MTHLSGIIERLERANAGMRLLDFAIARANPIDGWRVDDNGNVECYGDMGDGPGWFPSGQEVPKYTSSIDAALTLVPGTHRWLVDKRDFSEHIRHHGFRAHVWCPPTLPYSDTESWGATGAIALVIAALRARARKVDRSGK